MEKDKEKRGGKKLNLSKTLKKQNPKLSAA